MSSTIKKMEFYFRELLTDTTEYDITLRFLYNGQLGVITDDNSLDCGENVIHGK